MAAKVSKLTFTPDTFLTSIINYGYKAVADCLEGMKYIEHMWCTNRTTNSYKI
jgi:hypothetical protein